MAIIDHIGIAVKSLADSVPVYASLLGQNPAGEEDVPSESVRVAFFGSGPGRVELLEPTAPGSPIARFLERRGPGIHHVCFAVADVEAAVRRAEEAGLTLIPPGVRPGAEGKRVAFLHPGGTGGVLIELSGPGASDE